MDPYDVAIIGAGVSGANIARRLSAYKLSVALIDREVDVSFGVSKANSGIIHGGFHHKKETLKARLELAGALLFDALHRELDFPYRRCGILVAAFSEEEMASVQTLLERGRDNGVMGIEACSRERILGLEPLLHPDVVGGLYAPTGGIVEPYRFVFALVENAVANGVGLVRGFELAAAERSNGIWTMRAADGRTLGARRVVNAAGLHADAVSALFGAEAFSISGRRGEYFLLDRLCAGRPSRVIFPVPSSVSKGMLVIPTVEDTVLLGPTAEAAMDKEDLATTQEGLGRILGSARHLVPSISAIDVISAFAGMRPVLSSWKEPSIPAPLEDDFYIALSAKAEGLVQVAGIQSPGLTASPAIGEYVKDLLRQDGLELTEKASLVRGTAKHRRLRDMSPEEAAAAAEADPAWGSVVCRCERVSEAEIVEAVRLGHDTLDGVKFFTRAQAGRCQGGFCSYKIIRIIMRETGKSWDQVTKRGGASRVLGGEL